MVVEKLPPHDTEAEEAVVASLLVDPEAIYTIANVLKPGDFFREKNGWAYEACLALWERREAINQITVAHELARRGRLAEIGGNAYLSQLVGDLPTSVGAKFYAEIIQRDSSYRKLIAVAQQIAQMAYQGGPDVGEALGRAETLVTAIRQGEALRDFVHIKDLLAGYQLTEPSASALASETSVIRTGFMDLDTLLGGLKRSDLIVVAARPSLGKTSLALNFARNAAIGQSATVAVFSLEMAAEQLVQRLIALDSGVDSTRLRLGQHTDREERQVMRAMGSLAEANIYVDDSAMVTVAEMRAKARRLHMERGLDLIIVDFLQLMHGGIRADNRVQEVSYISRSLKQLARDLGRASGGSAPSSPGLPEVPGRPRAPAQRPEGVGQHRAGRRRRDVHLPGGRLHAQGGVGEPAPREISAELPCGRCSTHRRQAPERAHWHHPPALPGEGRSLRGPAGTGGRGVGRGSLANPFAGFPASGEATALPNLFFSAVLPQIERAEELIVTLYFFFAQSRKRGSPRFLPVAELAADATLIRTLGHFSDDPQAALARGLSLAVQRRTLLRVEGETEGRRRELYLLNSPASRRAVARLPEVNVQEPSAPAQAEPVDDVLALLTRLYEENVGTITQVIADELRDAAERYRERPQWIEAAFRETAAMNVRNWKYIRRILERWEVEGPDHGAIGRNPQADWLERRYVSGKGGPAGPR